jgi:D-hydroxyproline dehydrogenase subunit alpha
MSNRTKKACDVLVVGAGPAGIAAAISATEVGATVLLVDDNAHPGGQIWRAGVESSGAHNKHADEWISRLYNSGADFLPSTTVVAKLGRNTVLAENSEGALVIEYQSAVLATGARELLLPFPGWTLQNIFTAGGLQALVKSGMSVRGQCVVVLGAGPLLLAVAAFLRREKAVIAGIFEQSPLTRLARFATHMLARPTVLWDALRYKMALRVVPYDCGWWPVAAEGDEKVSSISVTNGRATRMIACDMVACSFHLVPNAELPSIFGCRMARGIVETNDWQQTSIENVFSAGETTGVAGADAALIEGRIAGYCAAGKREKAAGLLPQRRRQQRWGRAVERAFALRPELRNLPKADTIICRCEDVPWSALRDANDARSAKLYTRCGMGPCQGRICGAALRFLSGWHGDGWSGDLVRPPVFPVQSSTLIANYEAQIQEEPS